VDETGAGNGSGYNINVPLPSGAGDPDYLYIFNEILVPTARKFKPDIILVSAGQDGHRDDPLAGMNLTSEGFGQMTAIVRSLAEELCGGKLVLALEGGYNYDALSESVVMIFRALMDEFDDMSGTEKGREMEGRETGTEKGEEQVSDRTRQVVEKVMEFHSGGKIL
jgi:acetoin utilization deacetylase AcuC-like enzyme